MFLLRNSFEAHYLLDSVLGTFTYKKSAGMFLPVQDSWGLGLLGLLRLEKAEAFLRAQRSLREWKETPVLSRRGGNSAIEDPAAADSLAADDLASTKKSPDETSPKVRCFFGKKKLLGEGTAMGLDKLEEKYRTAAESFEHPTISAFRNVRNSLLRDDEEIRGRSQDGTQLVTMNGGVWQLFYPGALCAFDVTASGDSRGRVVIEKDHKNENARQEREIQNKNENPHSKNNIPYSPSSVSSSKNLLKFPADFHAIFPLLTRLFMATLPLHNLHVVEAHVRTRFLAFVAKTSYRSFLDQGLASASCVHSARRGIASFTRCWATVTQLLLLSIEEFALFQPRMHAEIERMETTKKGQSAEKSVKDVYLFLIVLYGLTAAFGVTKPPDWYPTICRISSRRFSEAFP